MEQEKNHIELKKGSYLSGLSEDIWAVVIGGLLVTGILAAAFFLDIKFTAPVYQWKNGDDLQSKVFTGSNLFLLVIIGILFLFISSLAVAASGNSIKKYIAGFAVIFILAIISLIIAGNQSISYYGI